MSPTHDEGGGTARALTIHERVLLHLAPFAAVREAYTVPREVTQAGISAAVGIRVAHASRELSKMIDAGLIEERDAAVEGSRRRLKAYFLSRKGADREGKLRAERADLPAPPPTATPAPAGPRAPACVTREFPSVRYFFGRADEIERARKALEDRSLLVVLGIAGIGKSTLGAHLFGLSSAKRPSVWVSLRDYDTGPSVLAPIARLLALADRPRLEMLLRREAEFDLARASDVLREDLGAARAAVFLDDVQSASREVLHVVRALKEAAAASKGSFKLVLLSRTRPPVYDERDLRVTKIAVELELEGLSGPDAARLLDVSHPRLDAANVYRVTGGHPLFIELLRDAPDGSPTTHLDARPLDRFVADQIFSHLSAAERETLRRCAFFRRPIDPRSFLPPGTGLEALLSLEARSLVHRDARGRVVAHEAIRDFVLRTLTAAEEQAYAGESYRALFEAAEVAETRVDAAEAVELFEDALPLAREPRDTVTVLAELASCHLTLGQYSLATARLKEALPLLDGDARLAEGGEVYYLMGAVSSETGAGPRAREFLERAWDAAAGGGPGLAPARARVALEFARWEMRYGSPPSSLVWLDRAVELADAHDRALLEAEAAVLRSHVLPLDISNAQLDRAIQIAEASGYRPTLSRAHVTYAWHILDAYGDIASALDHGRKALEVARTLQNPGLMSMAHASIAKALWRSGDLESALTHASAGIAGAAEHGGERIVPVALLSTLTTESGDPKRGEALARALLESAVTSGSPFEVLMAKRALMRSLIAQRRTDEAAALLVEMEEQYSRHGSACDLPVHVATLMRLVRADAARGRMAEADRWRAKAEQLMIGLRTPVAEIFHNMIVGHYHATQDPGEAALGYFRASRALGAIEWRAMQARILQAAWTLAKNARTEAANVPSELPTQEALRSEVDSLTSRVKIPARAALSDAAEL